MARIFETAIEKKVSPILKNMTIGQAAYIFSKAGIAVEVNGGSGVRFVENYKK